MGRPVTDFSARPWLPLARHDANGYRVGCRCEQCTMAIRQRARDHRARNYESAAKTHRRSHMTKHGITLAVYEGLLELQGGVCASCGRAEMSMSKLGNPKSLSIDHDHGCCPTWPYCGNCVRGLLCHHCNAILGQANDSIELLESVIAYLREWQGHG